MTEAQELPDARLMQDMAYKYRQQSADYVFFQLDSTDVLEQLRMDLLGMEYEADGYDQKAIKTKKALINKEGADTVLAFLRPRITKVMSLSNLEEQDIRMRCQYYMDTLSFMIVRHKQEFDIPSLQIVDNIIELCDDVFFSTMMKAIGGWEGDGIRKQQTVVESRETITENKPTQKMPFINPLQSMRGNN